VSEESKREFFMRNKVLEYLQKPTKKLLGELTTMEQKWVAQQLDKGGPSVDKPKPK